jgi:two-component system CheB/CheR fusion protein
MKPVIHAGIQDPLQVSRGADPVRAGGIGVPGRNHPAPQAAAVHLDSSNPGVSAAESVAANGALAESELKFRRLFETISDAAFVFDGQTRRLLEVNAAALQLYGYSRDEFLALRQPDLTAEPEATEAIIQLVLAGARPRIPVRYHRKKDGTVFPVEISANSFALRGRTMVCGVIRDITSRTLAQEALRRREQELADFFAESPLGLMWVAPNGRIQRVNQAQLAILGCRGEAVYGQMVPRFHADPDEAADLLRRLARGETIRECRCRMLRADGNIREVLIDANGLWEKDVLVHSRWFIRDITHSMNLEREILQISERERHRLGRDLHDDLCQQLVGIEFLCQRLASRLERNRADRASVNEIARMVQRALAQGRELAHGLSPVALEAEGLAEALRTLAARTRKVFRVDCHFRSPGSPLVPDPTVAGHLYRVAQEAVTNALKHGKARRVDIRLAQTKKGIRLSVRDDGTGLPPDVARLDGMGLSIMRYRAEVMGGTLAVKGAPGCGTRVLCLVPHAPAARRGGGFS